MKKSKIIFIGVLCLFMQLQLFGQIRQPLNKSINLDIDLKSLKNNTSYYEMNIKGKKVGSWEWEVTRKGKLVTFKDISILDGRVREDAFVTMDTDLMEVTKMDVKLKFAGGVMTGKMKANGAKLKADYTIKRGENIKNKGIDTTMHHWVARPFLIGLMPYIKFKPDYQKELTVFGLAGAGIWQMKMQVLGEAEIQVPAGKFQTQKIALKSEDRGSTSNIFYISKSLPHKIVRVEVIGTDMVIELVK